MASHRPERVRERIHQEISVMFAREVGDPRLENLNVTRVDVSGDLRVAKVYVTPRADDAATQETMDALARATGYFRHRLAEKLDLRFAPEFRFLVDQSIEKGEHFIKVLAQVEAEERAAVQGKRKTTRKQK
jgi:ribosome-binding factor A